ncbi:MAG: hypothetical protein RLZZ324_281, partial [Candidatus Parcubacteria bacterium]
SPMSAAEVMVTGICMGARGSAAG